MTSTVTRSGRRWLRRPGRTLAEVTTILVAAVVAFPLYWMLLTALKPQGQIHSQHPRPWTSVLTLDNFRRVFTNQQIGLYFLNSVVIAAAVVLLALFISFLAAVALSRFRFRGRTVLVLLVLIAQMVPVEALTIPLFFLARSAGSVVPVLGLNHLGSLVLVHLTFSLPFAIWMLRGFVAAVPTELEEAATIDGASRARFTWQVLFPLVAPGLVAMSVVSFIHAWNDFLFAKTFIISNTDKQPLPLAILSFFDPTGNDWGAIMAGSTLMTIPVLVFFVFVQRHLVSGMAGAVKG